MAMAMVAMAMVAMAMVEMAMVEMAMVEPSPQPSRPPTAVLPRLLSVTMQLPQLPQLLQLSQHHRARLSPTTLAALRRMWTLYRGI
jgi:hypothetical protein